VKCSNRDTDSGPHCRSSHTATMPPRLNIWSACRALSTRAFAQRPQPGPAVLARGMADSTTSRLPEHNSANLPPSMLPESETPTFTSKENEAALNQLRMIEYGLTSLDASVEGHKYGVPELPLPSQKHNKHRYDAVVSQITRLLMRDGKLAKAQRVRRERRLLQQRPRPS